MLARSFWSEVTSRNFVHIASGIVSIEINGRGYKAVDGIIVGIVAVRILQVHGHALAEDGLLHLRG